MPNPALNAYLAEHYLDGAKAEAYLARSGEVGKEKRKKKREKRSEYDDPASNAFRVVDDEDDSWRRQGGNASDEDDAALVVMNEADRQQSRSKWSRVSNGQGPIEAERDQDDLPQMANEQGMALDADEQGKAEQALLHPSSPKAEPPHAPTIRAGLKTREEMRAERVERERREAEQREAEKRRQSSSSGEVDEQTERRRKREREQGQGETVYRDASGRKIDVRQEDEEHARKRRDDEQKEREKREWTKGEVQRDQARRAREREEHERSTSFARHATDERMNQTLRNVERANDPAARFLTQRKKDEGAGAQRPTFKGSFPPNRFGIRPGYRWDGVERSNGFEAKLFQRRNERMRYKAEKQAWGQEDM